MQKCSYCQANIPSDAPTCPFCRATLTAAPAMAQAVAIPDGMIACRTCARPIAKTAPTCPGCGAQNKKKGMGCGTTVVLALVTLGVIGAIGASINKSNRKEAVRSGTNAVDVTAKQLLAEYHANEVSADDHYKGKVLRVSGTIDAIRKGITDEPYLVLRAGEMFDSVQAHFEDDAQALLRRLSNGESVTVRCIGDGMILNSPMLKDCIVE